jgi:hypothetical protein
MTTRKRGLARREPAKQKVKGQLVPSLARQAREISREHAAAEASFREGSLHAKRVGELLLQVKGQLKHGQYLPWVESHCPFGERTAERYVEIFEHWAEIEAKRRADPTRASDLSIRAALALLSPPPAEDNLLPQPSERPAIEGASTEGAPPAAASVTGYVAERDTTGKEMPVYTVDRCEPPRQIENVHIVRPSQPVRQVSHEDMEDAELDRISFEIWKNRNTLLLARLVPCFDELAVVIARWREELGLPAAKQH